MTIFLLCCQLLYHYAGKRLRMEAKIELVYQNIDLIVNVVKVLASISKVRLRA